ncbi:MAG: 3-oxoacyl-ACP reductase FabG [Gammaproteobacteria bacterium]|nr:MAG: 3-oxoacyl-ACP reductase FabG [Gammaproteobacteria bacterium]
MKRALVTGGSGDIGRAICLRLAADGYEVLVHGASRPERAEEVAEAIRAAGGHARSLCFDVTDEQAARAALEPLAAEQPVQVVIHNAGIHDDAPLAGMNGHQWQRVIDVSLNGFHHVVQPLLLPMMSTRWGRVIAMSSVAAILGNRGQANYAAAKAGLHGAVRSLARELASRGITANVVAPGIIEGSMTEGLFDREQIRQMVPAARAGQPEEVAELVAFLASERAGYINGQVIGINGGMA